jgi:hypothetical protein
LKKQYGEPLEDDYYNGGRYVRFAEGTYFISDGGKVYGRILGENDTLNVFGAQMGMTFAEINQAFGVDPNQPPEYSEMEENYVVRFERDGYKIRFEAPTADSVPNVAFITHPELGAEPASDVGRDGFPDLRFVMEQCPASALKVDGDVARCSDRKMSLIVTGDWSDPQRAFVMFDSEQYFYETDSRGTQMVLTFMEAMYGAEGQSVMDDLVEVAREKAEARANGDYEVGSYEGQAGDYQVEVTGAPNIDLASQSFGMEYGFNGIVRFDR